MSAGPFVTSAKWPRQVSRGDERWMPEGLTIAPHPDDRLRVQFLFGDAIGVSGPHEVAKNTFDLPPSDRELKLGVKYLVRLDAVIDSRVDVAVAVRVVRWNTWRIALGGVLLFIAVVPEAWALLSHIFHRNDSSGQALGIDDKMILTIPLVMLIGIVIVWSH